MKTFDEHIDDVIKEYGVAGTVGMQLDSKTASREMVNEAAKRYAREAIAEHLERAAENVDLYDDIDQYGTQVWHVNKESITGLEIILK